MTTAPSRAVYLSPHADDAVLACGGQIHRRVAAGERVLVLTVFAGDPPAAPLGRLAERLHRAWGGAAGVMERRRAEDRQACAVLGAELEQWRYPDALYRQGPGGAPLYPALGDLFGAPRAADEELVIDLAGRLQALPAVAELVAPLAVGGHVDHRLVRRAAEEARRPLRYYEDYPYVTRRFALGKALGTRRGWRPLTWTLGDEDVAARLAAVAAYTSQLEPLFGGRERMERSIRRHVRRRGGERLWERPAAGAP